MSSESSTIHITNIIEEDAEEIYTFAVEYFFKYEPLNKFLELSDYDDETKEFILSGISDHCSFKAVDDKGYIIGIVLNRLTKRPISDKIRVTQKESETEKLISLLLDYCEEQWNIFDLYPNSDVIFDCKILAVHNKYRGFGIGGQLIQKCREYMLEHNIPVLKVVCTSHFSARVMEKMGMKEVHKLMYKDFKLNGEVVLKPEAPHVACRSFVMEI